VHALVRRPAISSITVLGTRISIKLLSFMASA
jgi:hypothetical protein